MERPESVLLLWRLRAWTCALVASSSPTGPSSPLRFSLLPPRSSFPFLGSRLRYARGSTTDDPIQLLFQIIDLFPDRDGLLKLLERYVGKRVGLHGNPVRESSARSQGLIRWEPYKVSGSTTENRSSSTAASSVGACLDASAIAVSELILRFT